MYTSKFQGFPEILRLVDRGNNPLFDLSKRKIFESEKRNASSGNRTRAARVAGEHSTTEPTMLAYEINEIH